jgi:hypothetical protein
VGSFKESGEGRDGMGPFGSTILLVGAVFSAFVAPFASQVLADSVGPATLEAENVSVATCKSEDIVMSQASSASASSCSQKEREPDETARARAYLGQLRQVGLP